MSRRGRFEECPDCFTMLNLRRKTFRDLQDYQFTGPEKDFIIGEIILLDEQKFDELLIHSHFPTVEKGRKSTGVSKIAQRYNIRLTTIKNWLKRSKSSGKCLSATTGRPLTLAANERQHNREIAAAERQHNKDVARVAKEAAAALAKEIKDRAIEVENARVALLSDDEKRADKLQKKEQQRELVATNKRNREAAQLEALNARNMRLANHVR